MRPRKIALRIRLHNRLLRGRSPASENDELDAMDAVNCSDELTDEVLRRLDGEKDAGDGGLWDFIEKVNWVRLIAIILEVVKLFANRSEAEEETV